MHLERSIQPAMGQKNAHATIALAYQSEPSGMPSAGPRTQYHVG
jgi:hypothetical protein